MPLVEIHEFSTGIHVQDLGDGQWVSRGFTGSYMGNTLKAKGEQIPIEVEQAISNREFAVSEGAFTNEPAIIAREIPESPWSVVAVISRGEDDKGRSASFYRYFLCCEPENGYAHNEDGISFILEWMKRQRMKLKRWPQFAPLNTRIDIEHDLEISHQLSEEKSYYYSQELLNTSIPYIWRPNLDCVPIILHVLSKLKAQEAKAPVSWAYRVSALEKPWSFTIVFPSSTKSEEIIKRAILNAPADRTTRNVNEDALNKAIKELTDSSKVKLEDIKTILEAATNKDIPEKLWSSLFDKRGAHKAISLKIHNPNTLRLICLRAIILPKTLPNYLQWVNFTDSNNKKIR
ncbi:hypothetical protein HRE53_21525 [Acaryochloris sp. 'Moss Beach']|uniref:hypothetical protein n=1 Tax=Acaryochloris sp. 'Moss Beach' TaxID=2740837 RepID=UPI001F47FCB2|nr:hypothetical protein [Acaryochloris sp. 'Moss Beach']UJB68980.1 hypothetical protein HRE53_21525 [Acaryochloris sp. 'Moss Beach']